MEERVSRLLSSVWGTRQGYIFIPFKDLNKRWHETPGVPYDGNVPSLEELPTKADIYFCPVVFSQPKRRKEYALTTNLLWADLDPVHPDKCRVKPSIAWESSPGRYQALWFLSSEIPAEEASSLSKRIAYADGGDKGGWDVTQVLRLPGTHNYKYDSAPEVKLLWAKREQYSTSEILAAYPAVNGEALDAGTALQEWPAVSRQVIQAAIASLPFGVRKRIVADTSGADRSLELQKLTRDILRFGVAPDVVVNIIKSSTWNKFAGRKDEQEQLLKQVRSAVAAIAKKPHDDTKEEPLQEMQVHDWASFMQIPTSLRWLIDDAWVDQTVGFISGRAKSYKTWMALDLALSVVSGRPFLGRYPVRRTGPVLLIQEEDPTAVVQERLNLISKAKGMLPIATSHAGVVHIEYPEYPLHIINLQGFTLGAQEKVDQVREFIAKNNPVMVILDPLVVMLGNIDEYKATEVAMVLQTVKMWREEFGCSVLIVHHWNKGKTEDNERFAQHLYGSFAFHAWLESALHVLPVIEEGQERIDTVVVEREFKAAPSGRALQIKFAIDTIKEYTYEVEFLEDTSITPTAQQILDSLASGGPQTTPELVAVTGHPRPRIVETVGKLVRAKLVLVRKGGGRGKSSIYWLPGQEEPK